MKTPSDVKALLLRRFQTQHREWLLAQPGDQPKWPQDIKLGLPTEQVALRQPEGVRAWAAAWKKWQGAGEVKWVDKRWRSLGTQHLPEKVMLYSPEQVAQWCGELERWACARQRHCVMLARWPRLESVLSRYFAVLADYDTQDFQRLCSLLDWLLVNPNSNLYSRQLPIPGLDSKWLEASRMKMITHLLATAKGHSGEVFDFYSFCGLKPAPRVLRLRLLDPHLRALCGGLGDICAPSRQIAELAIPVRRVVITENLQTGLAFEDLPGTLLICGLGYAVDVLGELPWLQNVPCHYWGDLDTHGFAILNRARSYLPDLKSLMMDEATLLEHHALWGVEVTPFIGELTLLNDAEQALYQKIRGHELQHSLRLEQERIDWGFAWAKIAAL